MIKSNRKALCFFMNLRIFYGKPASTFPENALAAMLWAFCLGLCVLASAACFGTHAAVAQAIGAEPEVQVPGFWDPRRRPERPDLGRVSVIRFMTEIDYPPFNFAGPDGNPQGFNVDLARMMCEELKLACTIQMRRFETLVASLNENRGDAAIASIAVTPEMRAKVDFTDPYYRMPGRFVARRDSPIADTLPEKLEGKKVAVVAGTAHEAYLKALFTEVETRPYPNAEVALQLALRHGRCRPVVRRRGVAGVLAQRHRFEQLLRVPRWSLYGQPLLRRRRRHRGQEEQRYDPPCAQLVAVPPVGARTFHRSLAAVFSDQPVLKP